MSDNIVAINFNKDSIFICDCDCITFKIYQDMRIECAKCGAIQHLKAFDPDEI